MLERKRLQMALEDAVARQEFNIAANVKKQLDDATKASILAD
jgi:hypothetical protein